MIPPRCRTTSAASVKRLGEFPILFTFRSVNEGGHLTPPAEEYITLTKAMIDSGALTSSTSSTGSAMSA